MNLLHKVGEGILGLTLGTATAIIVGIVLQAGGF